MKRHILLLLIFIVPITWVQAQRANIRILGPPGLEVSISRFWLDTLHFPGDTLQSEILDAGEYILKLKIQNQILEIPVKTDGKNERIYAVNPVDLTVEDRSPVNRPGKEKLRKYVLEGLVYGRMEDPRDKKLYRTIDINGKIWMAENLDFEAGVGAYFFPRDTANRAIYGLLYNWETAMKACPAGWHLPVDEEWQLLEKYLGVEGRNLDVRGWRKVAAEKSLKSDIGWIDTKRPLEDNGFSAFPGGYFDQQLLFYSEGYYGYFWTATEGDEGEAWYRALAHDVNHIGRFSYSKKFGFSVRCVKD